MTECVNCHQDRSLQYGQCTECARLVNTLDPEPLAHLQMAQAYQDMAYLAYQKGDAELMQTFRAGALLALAGLAHKEGGLLQEVHDMLTVLYRMQ